MSIPEKILQAGCDAYTATFLIGNGSLGDGIEAAYLAIHGHDDWVRAGLPAWTGEGLPPVGTVCEHHKLIHGEEWTRVEIVAHRTFDGDDYPCAVFVYSQSSSHSSSGDHFRPCRTPEQIAAEERLAAINYMEIDAGMCATAFDGDPEVRAWVENLIDKGWRKPAPE